MAIHEYSRNAFIDARENRCAWDACENYNTQTNDRDAPLTHCDVGHEVAGLG